MSRIGKQPISIPAGVTITVGDREITVVGPKGQLIVPVQPKTKVIVEGATATVTREDDEPKSRAWHGLQRALLANAVEGVTRGYEKKLEINGVGYRLSGGGQEIEMALGFSHPVKYIDDTGAVRDITTDIVEYINDIEKETGREIPVIAAGGIWDGKDIQKFLDLGASGVQMATRFVATEECDASEEFKQAYIHAKKEDIKIIKSPVGLPGRAIYNEFIKKTETQKNKIDRCYQCIKTCNVATTPYCITKALINAVKGNMKEALIFCGSNVSKVKEIISVHALMNELVAGMAS